MTHQYLPSLSHRSPTRAADCSLVDARSALFDVYGDHLLSRGGVAPVAGLVRLLAPLDIAAPAVRTAISRMVRQRWLTAVRLESGAGYRLTPRAERRLAEAAARIYRSSSEPWDRRWHLLVLEPVTNRATRERLRTALGYLGYAPLREGTWISPRPSGEVASLLDGEGVRSTSFSAKHDGDDAALARSAWDLPALAAAYRRWLAQARDLVSEVASGTDDADQQAFMVRSRLVHEWRKFLFQDPGLPPELLPADWAGSEAAAFFDEQASRLLAGASRYVDACLAANGGVPPRAPRPREGRR